MKTPNYAKLKEQVAAYGLPVSEGQGFNYIDLASTRRYFQEQQFLGGTPGPFNGLYGLAFPELAPPEAAAVFAVGVQIGNVDLWSEAMKPNTDTLYAGTGNPASDFQIANGEKIQLGLAIRWKNFLGKYPQAKDGVITIPKTKTFTPSGGTEQTQPWTFLFSVACTADGSISDYDVTLTASLDSTGASTPVLSFAYDDGTWVSTPSGSNLTDSQGVSDKVSQNIQQYSFDYLKTKLLPTSMRDEAVPFGTYTLTLKSVHTESGEVTQAQVKVVVSDVE